MKRLKSKIRLCAGLVNIDNVYEGSMLVFWGDNSPPTTMRDNTYYSGEIGFTYDRTHKLALDRPTVTVQIPVDQLFNKTDNIGEHDTVKRLLYYLKRMEENTTTYRYYDPVTHSQKDMYDGEMLVHFPPKSDGSELEPEIQHDSRFWNDDISFELSRTNKLVPDKPTVTVAIPAEKLRIDEQRIESEAMRKAAADFCLRAIKPYFDALNAELYNRSRPDSENGRYYIHAPGGEVLTRNTAYFALCPRKDYVNGSGSSVYLLPPEQLKPPQVCLCIRMQVQLPRKRLKKAIRMLCGDLPDAVDEFVERFDTTALERTLELAEKQAKIRMWLKSSGYCAFIANGSILPRAKGTDLPMEGAIPFTSVPEDEVEICGVRGMAIKRGVTVITGGGYSGKSTLLEAIAAGIYDHCTGDGRELCITDESAVTISAEDGRAVSHVNISPFIKWIPGGDPSDFSTEHASGSTSQAANIMEAVDAGAKLLLIDEDRTATNFMIRDQMMKELIDKEPITPFTDRVRELYRQKGVSTILVIGGSGEYLSVADRIYRMDDFRIYDATTQAKEICAAHGVCAEAPPPAVWEQGRVLHAEGFTSYPEGMGSEKLQVSEMGFIEIGDEWLDVRGLHDIVSKRQIDALGFMLRHLMISNNSNIIDINARIEELYSLIERDGLDTVFSSYFTACERFLDLPRKIELFAAINRMRHAKFSKNKH